MAAKQTDAPVEGKGNEDTPTTAPQGENRSTLPESKRPPGDVRRRKAGPKRKGPFVKYVGSAAIRSIGPAAWKSLNIELKDDGATHSWNLKNDKMVEAENFSDAQLDYLLIDDLQQGSNTHAFLLVDYDNNGQLVQAVYE